MIKNIIFDLGNVIVQNPTMEVVKQFFKNTEDAEILNNYIFKSEYWKMMDLGQIDNETIANEIEEKRLVEISDYTEVHNFMNNWFSKCLPNIETMEVAKRLKEKGYKLYILSNMAKATYEYLSKTYEFFSIVDGAIVSANIGIKKPDRKIFDILLEKYSLNAEDCVLIDDDDTNRTLEMANALGIKGRRVLPNDVEDVVKELKEYGVDI
jgi:putative hydrolase of the HAD superfamily